MAGMTPEQASLRARMAAHKSWANTPDPSDRSARTAKARSNSPTQFEYHLARVPAEITDPDARNRAATSAHKAYMTQLAYRSSRARSASKSA